MKVFRPCVTFMYLVKKDIYMLNKDLAISDYFSLRWITEIRVRSPSAHL